MTQPTPEQLRMAREREFLLGQVSVDIEIALNKAGILLTQEQGYIAAEAAIQATEARMAAAVASLFDAIRHGDAEHQAWLKGAIDAHFAIRSQSNGQG